LLVNALNASAKVARYAMQSAGSTGEHAAPMPSRDPKQRFELSF